MPYLQPVVETMVPRGLLRAREDGRKAAVASLPDILRAGKAGMEKRVARDPSNPARGPVDAAYFADLVRFVVPPLVKARHKEPETEVQAVCPSLADCAGVAGALISEYIPSMIEEFQNTLAASLERRSERNKRAADEDFDAEAHEALKEEQAAEDACSTSSRSARRARFGSSRRPFCPRSRAARARSSRPCLAPDKSRAGAKDRDRRLRRRHGARGAKAARRFATSTGSRGRASRDAPTRTRT